MRVEVPRARLTHPEANGHYGARLVHGQRCFLRGRIRADWLLAGEAAIQWTAEGAPGAAGAGAPLPARSDTAGTDSVFRHTQSPKLQLVHRPGAAVPATLGAGP